MYRNERLIAALGGLLALSAASPAQDLQLGAGDYIGPADLPPDVAAVLVKAGSRLMDASRAQVSVAGTVTDAQGRRTAQITIQAPGYLAYREGQSRALTFDGREFARRSSAAEGDDERIMQSLLAHVPDALFLQFAAGGSWRRIGSHFRGDASAGDDGARFWTVWAFSPKPRPRLNRGQALQQDLYVAFDEETWTIAEVRSISSDLSGKSTVTQTRFSGWLQQNGQWFPQRIVRLEDGREVLDFQTAQVSVGAALPVASFRP
jgi:hypothetical protein